MILCLWDFPGINTGVGCHSLLQGIIPTQGSKAETVALAGGFFTSEPYWVGTLSYLEFIFVYDVQKYSNFILVFTVQGTSEVGDR